MDKLTLEQFVSKLTDEQVRALFYLLLRRQLLNLGTTLFYSILLVSFLYASYFSIKSVRKKLKSLSQKLTDEEILDKLTSDITFVRNFLKLKNIDTIVKADLSKKLQIMIKLREQFKIAIFAKKLAKVQTIANLYVLIYLSKIISQKKEIADNESNQLFKQS